MPKLPLLESFVIRARRPFWGLALLTMSAAAAAACESNENAPVPDVPKDGGLETGPQVDADADADVETDAGADTGTDVDAGGNGFEFVFKGGSGMRTAVFGDCRREDPDCNHGTETPSNTAGYFFDVHAPGRLRTIADYAGADISKATFFLHSFGSDETYLVAPMWMYGAPPKGTTLGADGKGFKTSFRYVDPEFEAWPSSLDEARAYTPDDIHEMFVDGAYYREGRDNCRRYHSHNRCDNEADDDNVAWPWDVSYILPGLTAETVWDYLVEKPFVVAFETRDPDSPETTRRRGLVWVQLHGTVEEPNPGFKRLAATGADLRVWLAD